MLARARPQVTRSDYESMPQGPPYFQLIEGELAISPSPLTVHQRIVGRIYAILNAFVQEHALGEVFIAPLDVHLNDVNIFQPDVMFVSRKRSRIITPRGVEGAPDLCVEVLSTSTSRHDRFAKKKISAQAGVVEYWIVQPKTRSFHVFHLQCDPERAVQNLRPPQNLRSPLFPGLDLQLSQVFVGCS